MKFFSAMVSALLLALVLSMCIVSAVDAKGIQVGEQAYGQGYPAAGNYYDQRQETTINIIDSPGATVAVTQQQSKTKDDVSPRGTTAAEGNCDGCEEEQGEDTVTPDEIGGESIPYDYVCIMLGDSQNMKENFYWVIGLFVDTPALDKVDGETAIPTDATLRDALDEAGEVVSNDAGERADQIREYWNGPLVVTSNNILLAFAVADNSGMSLECFKVSVDSDNRYKLTSKGWIELENSGAENNALVNEDGSVDNRIKASSAKQW
jgi:hypothetical protein